LVAEDSGRFAVPQDRTFRVLDSVKDLELQIEQKLEVLPVRVQILQLPTEVDYTFFVVAEHRID
jgi:hypothetical protein